MKELKIEKVQDITGNYWAIMDGDEEITSFCRADIDGNNGYTYEEVIERVRKLELN